ncbi:hypothetical protein AAG906_020975 [Vitis piasezkii]
MTRTKEERGSPMSFTVQVGGRNLGGDGKDKIVICSICKQKGHEAASCFQRIGYPKWWGDRPRTTTGASHHMTGTYECLNDLRDIMSCPVGLPNGVETKALKKGTVTLGEKLKLRHLLDDSDLVVQFTNKICAIQDRNSRMLIGAGEQHKGLYFLKGVDPIHAYKTTSIASYELWHRRMGHPSSRVVDLIYEVDSVSRNDGMKNKDVIFVEAEFSYFNNIVNSSLIENRVVDFSVDDEGPYMQNDMEEQQASVSDVEHEIDVEMGHNMEMATDGNLEVGDRALTCQDLWCLRNSLAREKGLSNLLFG